MSCISSMWQQSGYECRAAQRVPLQLRKCWAQNPRHLCTTTWIHVTCWRLGFVTKLIPYKKKKSLLHHFHRWCCLPAASCLQTKPYVAIQLQTQRSFIWLQAMERRCKHVLYRPGPAVLASEGPLAGLWVLAATRCMQTALTAPERDATSWHSPSSAKDGEGMSLTEKISPKC